MASEVRILTNNILEAKALASQLRQQNEELRARVNGVKAGLEWKVASREAIDDNLHSICDELDQQIQFMENAVSLCTTAVNNTDDTNNNLIASISRLILSIIGIGAVAGGALGHMLQVVSSGNGMLGQLLTNTGTQSTTPVAINTSTESGPTKPYQTSSVSYNGNDYSGYRTVGTYNPDAVLNQKDPRWINQMKDSKGRNAGCVCTSEAIIHNLKHPDKQISPLDCLSDNPPDCANRYSVAVKGSKTYDPQATRNIIAQTINSGEPTMVRINNHTVVGIGIKEGADPNNITNNDILCIDPADGKVKTVAESITCLGRKDIDASWSIRTAT